ncbi:hypothetical protein ABZZ79_27845 [Streptomyces sp. NPDC006458]|uniref:hypothetical protein n=1 Tax=Streptomyces sp. NPDC006458 TaxID=3154302 RepID=UPI0033A5921D
MTRRSRCPRGHFLPAADECRCQRPMPSPDLYGQRADRLQLRDMETIAVTARYL